MTVNPSEDKLKDGLYVVFEDTFYFYKKGNEVYTLDVDKKELRQVNKILAKISEAEVATIVDKKYIIKKLFL
jgi:hypothetical protein